MPSGYYDLAMGVAGTERAPLAYAWRADSAPEPCGIALVRRHKRGQRR